MKFRKKPVVIEAVEAAKVFQFASKDWGKLPEWIAESYEDGKIIFAADAILIITLEGKMRAEKDDWIIRGISGEIYPCKPDIFKKTYDEVNDEVDSRGDVEQPEKRESFRARMARQTAKNANRGGPHYQQIIDSIDMEARKGNYEIWWYVELSADLIKRLKEDGFVVGEQQWDRNEYLIKISW